MANSIYYKANSGLWSRFTSYYSLVTNQDIQEHRKNIIEKAGDVLLWPMEELPAKVWTLIKTPELVTILITKIALLTNSFVFYPVRTFTTIGNFIHWLPKPPFWALRFGSYLFTTQWIIGKFLRAMGRLRNKELMADFRRVPISSQTELISMANKVFKPYSSEVWNPS